MKNEQMKNDRHQFMT